MLILPNPTAKDEMIRRIRAKWFPVSETKRTGIHLSDLTYCITRSYWRHTLPSTGPTDREVLTWVVGLGLEKVLLEDEKNDNRPPSLILNGIHVSPDYQLTIADILGELKSTRLGFNKDEQPSKGYPLGWIKQMAGYSYVYKTTKYMLAIFQIIKADIYSKEIVFTREELEEFWFKYVIPRSNALIEALELGRPPEPFAYNEPWECQNCAFAMMCTTMSKVGEPQGYVKFSHPHHLPESFLSPEVKLG